MTSLNKVFICGRLGADPDIRYASNGEPVAKLRIATGEKYRGKDGQERESTQWHRVVVFGKQAEFCGNFLKRGGLVLIEGSIEYQEYEKDGQKRTSTEIKAFRVQSMGSKAAASASDPQTDTAQPDSETLPQDDLPF